MLINVHVLICVCMCSSPDVLFKYHNSANKEAICCRCGEDPSGSDCCLYGQEEVPSPLYFSRCSGTVEVTGKLTDYIHVCHSDAR